MLCVHRLLMSTSCSSLRVYCMHAFSAQVCQYVAGSDTEWGPTTDQISVVDLGCDQCAPCDCCRKLKHQLSSR